MDRNTLSRYDAGSSNFHNMAPPPAQQDAGTREDNRHAVDMEPARNESMPFPGPFAHDSVPDVVVRFGQADGAAAPAASRASNASSTAATSTACTNTLANSDGAEIACTDHSGQLSVPDGVETNPHGFPPLILAATLGNLKHLRLLLAQPGVDIDQVDSKFNATALMLAAGVGNLDTVELLLDRGAGLNFRHTSDGGTALIFACRAARFDVVNALLKRPGVVIDQTANGFNALLESSIGGHVDIVNSLLEAGADVNFRDAVHGGNPLIYASRVGRVDVVNALLKRADVVIDQTAANGLNALLEASINGHVGIVNSLLEAGADVNFKGAVCQCTALGYASTAGKRDVVNALLKRSGIAVDDTTASGFTALALACHAGHVDVVEQLINAGANKALLNAAGLGNMHYAIADGHANVVECLLKHGLPLPNLLPMPAANARHAICLSDLYANQGMPPASIDNPLRLLDPHLFDNPDRFFQTLIAALDQGVDQNATEALSGWLAAHGIRHAVIAPIVHSLGDLSQVWNTLAASGQSGPTAQQKLAYCACTMGRLALLAPDLQIGAPYRQAGLSAAGVKALSQLAIAQRDKLVALAEVVIAQIASDMFDQLTNECLAKTGHDLHVDVETLKAHMIDAGFVAPLAGVLATGWSATIGQVAGMPVAMPHAGSMLEMFAFLRERLVTTTSRLFIANILRQLDSPDLLTQWRAMLGDKSTEGLFALFDDQCRQLRQYCEQMGEHGA